MITTVKLRLMAAARGAQTGQRFSSYLRCFRGLISIKANPFVGVSHYEGGIRRNGRHLIAGKLHKGTTISVSKSRPPVKSTEAGSD